MLKGSCFCGGLRCEIDADLGPVSICYYGQCRKGSGAPFVASASVPTNSFRFVTGAELLREYESSAGVRRCFCGRCSSLLIKRNVAHPRRIRLRLGTLDSDPGVKPMQQIYVGSKAPWVEIADGLLRVE